MVNYVRRQVARAEHKPSRSIKVGHSGTLDPFATGLLIVLIGKNYTRQAAHFSGLDKVYEVKARLGIVSTTGDPEGQLRAVEGPEIDEAAVRAVLGGLTGVIAQTPPAYSAIKVGGQRAYKLARAGKSPVLPSRQVTVHSLIINQYTYPELQLTARVSSGTYIRSLVEVLGQRLGSGAYTTALRRTQIGSYSLSDAQGVNEITPLSVEAFLQSQ